LPSDVEANMVEASPLEGRSMGVTTHDATFATYVPGSERARRERIASLDITRGIVMVLMAIDHVRVYAGVPAGGPTPGVFFTRWVTHFSAPGFAFLAGTGAFLLGQKLADRRALARYLIERGVVLILLELTVLRLAWTFNADFANYNLAGVIWMLGWCMILMAGIIWLPLTAITVLGLALIVGQAAFAPISHLLPAAIGNFLYLGGEVRLGLPFAVLYVIVPWIGVMAIGYAFGTIMTYTPDQRRTVCLRIGLSATALFVIIAGIMVAREPSRPGAPAVLLRMLNQRKYPASPLFLMMTLGPILTFLPFAEQMRGRVASVLATFGRVPMFYYLLHIPLIHAAALVVSLIRTGGIDPWLFGNHPMAPPPVPEGYRWSLPLLYLVFAIVVALLYRPCRWYANLKARGTSRVLRYI
jgi:uncharacterized membrane protein